MCKVAVKKTEFSDEQSSVNSVHLSIFCIICYRQRESIVTCEIVVIPVNLRSIVLTCIKSLLLFNHCSCTFEFLTLLVVF